MRKVVVTVMLVTVGVISVAGAAGGHGNARAVHVRGRLSIRVPAGWHVLHGWLSDVLDPAPRLAVASFRARLSHHACTCGFPNVVNFPRDGAFLFVWEYLHPSRRGLARVPRRPAHFRLPAAGRVRETCNGATDSLWFKDAGRDLEMDVYLGPAAAPALRHELVEMLDSLRVAPRS